ncbi:MAG: hypothetical protein ACYDB7_01995 [Mycobacteriales bacterium]
MTTSLPTARRLATIGALTVFVPGVAVFAVIRWVGGPVNVAGIAGLFTMVAGLGVFPAYLRRLGRKLPPR